MNPTLVLVVRLAVVAAIAYAFGYRAGLRAVPPPRIVPLKPGKRKPPLRITKRGPRG